MLLFVTQTAFKIEIFLWNFQGKSIFIFYERMGALKGG